MPHQPDALDAAIAAYLADLSKPVVPEIGKGRLDVAAAVLAHQWSAEELAVEGMMGIGRTRSN